MEVTAVLFALSTAAFAYSAFQWRRAAEGWRDIAKRWRTLSDQNFDIACQFATKLAHRARDEKGES